MNQQEAAALLAVAAAFDNRKPDPDAASAWAVALHDVRFEDARNAVIEHYRNSSEWLMPAMVTSFVKALVSSRHRRFGTLIPPARLEGDPDREREWFQWAFAEVSSGRANTPADIQMDERPLPAHLSAPDEPRRLANPVASREFVAATVAKIRAQRVQPETEDPA